MFNKGNHMTNKNNETTKPANAGVIAKLKANKEAHSGDEKITLPDSKVEVTFPKFRNHGVWMQSVRLAKNDLPKAQTFYVCKVARFDGEKISHTDFDAYMSMSDAVTIIGEVFGGSDDEDDDGFAGKLN
jgi:hypothetical protein